MRCNSAALGIFFRIPQIGKVKRRLAKEIGEEATLKAYESMLKATIDNVTKLKGIDLFGFYEGEVTFLNLLHYITLPLILQKGFNLGERMYEAIQWLNQKGYKKVSLIGTDTPDLPISFIKMAFQKLDSYELVIGPSEDGGYYLIGMKKPYKEIFKNIVWGRDRVLKDTISNAINAGISYFLLSEWYDIDDTNTLNRWRLSKKRNWSDNVIKPVLKDCI
ncbi:MAG: TIGR04282 family arsenosugar biosynthesis glycosyltransferase [Thermodesulfovibrionales bacterium]